MTIEKTPHEQERCDGRYPVMPGKRDEPFDVTYRCALVKGHLGPHGNGDTEPMAHPPLDARPDPQQVRAFMQEIRASLPQGDGRWEAVCKTVCERVEAKLEALLASSAPEPTKELAEALSGLFAPDAGGIPPILRLIGHLAGNTKGQRVMVQRETLVRLLDVVKALRAPLSSEGPSTVQVLPSAVAGLVDAIGGTSGAQVIELGSHEITDLRLSGRAYSLDGKYCFEMADDSLARLAPLPSEGVTAPSTDACPHCGQAGTHDSQCEYERFTSGKEGR